MNERLSEIVDEARLVVAKMEIEHLCDDVMVAKEYCAIQYALSRIKEQADAKDTIDL